MPGTYSTLDSTPITGPGGQCRHGHFGNPRICGFFFTARVQLADNTYWREPHRWPSVSFSLDIRRKNSLIRMVIHRRHRVEQNCTRAAHERARTPLMANEHNKVLAVTDWQLQQLSAIVKGVESRI